MMAQVELRPMVAGDKRSIMGFLPRVPEFLPAEVFVAEEVIDEYLEDPTGSGYSIWVAEAGPAIVGYICFGPTPLTEGTWDIYWIAVDPASQSRGAGKALIGLAEGKIVELKGRLIVIETSAKPLYRKTISFYIGRGYSIVARIPGFYAPGDDKLVLLKCLR
ncbi:MAG: GNAT family N-acetyltransferase [Chloroflexi bacterium]|nr:GNAT family N-acetyltransferase [Chloroflexota bacterium]